MKCDKIKKDLGRYIDHELDQDRNEEVKAHLETCGNCKRELEILRSVNEMGETPFFEDPGRKYWRSLSRNIQRKVEALDRKQETSRGWAERIWKRLWPSETGWRLAHAGAVIAVLFIVVRLSLFNRDRIPVTERPALILRNEAVDAQKQKEPPDTVQEERKDADGMTLDKKKGAEIRANMSDAEKSSIQRDQKLGPEKKEEEPAFGKRGEASGTVGPVLVGGVGKQAEGGKGRLPAEPGAEPGLAAKSDEPAVHADRIIITEEADRSDQARMKAPEPSLYMAEDDTFTKPDDLSIEISRWERLLESQPEEEKANQAKIRLSSLYYARAVKSGSQKYLTEALSFLKEHLLFLGAFADTLQAPEKIAVLEKLLDSTEKK